MTSFHGDPYRILGLLPGATETQVKSAYRRLVKKYHPDAAGDSTIGRFLAVQAAYDALMDPASGRLRARPRTSARRAPWSADEDRVWATRRAYGRPAGPSAGEGRRASPGSSWDWARPGAGASTDGATTGSSGAAGGRRSAGARPDGRSATGERAAGGRSRGKSRQRDHHVPKARPGSTSYDDAERDPEPEWDGATWYGATSGTYWTINPKEYADPRKHGPEYQARAWRAVMSSRRDGPGTHGTGVGAGAPRGPGVPKDDPGPGTAPGPAAQPGPGAKPGSAASSDAARRPRAAERPAQASSGPPDPRSGPQPRPPVEPSARPASPRPAPRPGLISRLLGRRREPPGDGAQ